MDLREEGDIFFQNFDFKSAIEKYTKYLDSNPNDIKTLMNLGNACGRTSDLNSAIKMFKKVLDLDSKNKDAWYGLAGSYRRIGKHEDSLDAYDECLQIVPNNIDALFNKGQTYRLIGEFEKDIECLKKILEIDPKYYQAYYNMGFSFEQLGNIHESIASYEKALEIKTNEDILCNLAIAYGKINELDKAEDVLKKALKINPNDQKIWYNLGIVYRYKKDKKNQIECLEKAIELNPEDKNPWIELSFEYIESENWNLLEKNIRKFEDMFENDTFLRHFNADLLIRYQKYEKSLECYNLILKISPNDAKALYRIGFIYYKKNETEISDEYFSQAQEIGKNSNINLTGYDKLSLNKLE